MTPRDVRFYTWVDVEDVLLTVQAEGRWPSWLTWARAYWDGLTLGIRPGTQTAAVTWLQETFDPRYDPARQSILLESTAVQKRVLPVILEETLEEPPSPRFVPSLARPGVLWIPEGRPQPPAPFPAEFPPVVAFHSFKGGVGRTLHAVALSRAITEGSGKVLLVDGDLEAPGISWLVGKRLPDPPVSFADLLALAHGDPDPSAVSTVQLVAERLQSALLDGIYVLPAFRPARRFASLDIRPEHLVRGSEDPFVLTNLLTGLGKVLGVRAVIVDLRAGLSELAAGLLLDPRVYRVLVTTTSGQSVAGTCQLLEILGQLAPSTRDEDPLPALLITQVPPEHSDGELLAEIEERLLDAGRGFLTENSTNEDLLRVVSPFDAVLLPMPLGWEEVLAKLHRTGVVDVVRPLVDWLPLKHKAALPAGSSLRNLEQARKALGDFAERLEYAEKGEGEEFLAIPPLRYLAQDHQHQVPVSIVIGAKGAGKTYTFLQIARRQRWETFVRDALAPNDAQPGVRAAICPALEPKNLEDRARELMKSARRAAASELGLEEPLEPHVIRDFIRDGLSEQLHEGQWRERWLDALAWSTGFKQKEPGAGRAFVEYLMTINRPLVVVVDGLEDLFQNLSTSEREQTALRALLQEVPEWLSLQPSRVLGMVVFVRRDMVLGAVRQNATHLMSRYEPYTLKWSSSEALRLAAWISVKAAVLTDVDLEKVQEMTAAQLIETLTPLWGRKLGHERSKEARSSEWVVAALSDFRGQIQARDVVRLLHLAARYSMEDRYWQDRVLTPQAMRNALPECSRRKIGDIEQENEELKKVFTHLRRLPEKSRWVPFMPEQVQLGAEQLTVLEQSGVVFRVRDKCYMPEIYRLGLDFRLTSRAKPQILALYRRARRRESQ